MYNAYPYFGIPPFMPQNNGYTPQTPQNGNLYGQTPYTANNASHGLTVDIVENLEAAKNYQLAPNAKIILFDRNNDIFYRKETNGQGQVLAFDVFDFSKRSTAQTSPEYLTKTQAEQMFADFEKKLETLLKK